MSIVIFGDSFSFPEGDAATNRVHTYAKGFNENSITVHVICFGSQYTPIGEGETNGIYFYHPFGQKKRNKYFVIRRWQKFIKYFKAIRLFWEINEKDKIIATICYTQLIQTQLFAFIVSKFIKSKNILERSEHPYRNFQSSFFKKNQGKIKSYLETILCNGIFCISQYLIDFYKTRGVSQRKLIHVPSTVDTQRFSILYNSPLPFQFILYCGSLERSKDGTDILIKSFSKISEKYPKINLVLIGKGDTIEEEDILKDLVTKYKISNRVFFLGYLSRTKIPAYLKNAKILTLARPSSIVAEAGFPSKLTEYLATGKPIVVTKVGDIPIYLKDNENAFLAIPDNVDAFAEKLDYILSNYEFAQEVGEKGKELTTTIFNYGYQAKRMIAYLYSLNGSGQKSINEFP